MEWLDVALVPVITIAGPSAVAHILQSCSAWRDILDNEDTWNALLEALCRSKDVVHSSGSAESNAYSSARSRFVTIATRQVHFLGGGMEQLRKHPFAPSLVREVCCGRFHTVYLTFTGDAFTFGDGTYGCLGNSSFDSSEMLVRICIGQVVDTPVSIVDRPPRSLAEARARGRALKAASAKARSVRQEVDLRHNIIAVAAGGSHTTLISRAGQVFTCGSNSQGQLGIATPEAMSATLIRVEIGWQAAKITCGEGHTVVLGCGEVPLVGCWGQNKQGQAGIGVAPGEALLKNQPRPVIPQFQSEDNLTVITHVEAGGLHTLALASDGRAWAWGSNAYGQCGRRFSAGLASANSDVFTPMVVEGLHQPIVKLHAGWFHSLAILEDRSLVAWGCNKKGQLGVVTESACNPEPLAIPRYTRATLASCGVEHTAVLLDGRRELLTCGNPSGGRLGRDDSVDENGEEKICSTLEPASLGLDCSGRVIGDVIAGWHYTMLLTSSRA